MSDSVVILGGGLAGIAAAVRLCELGMTVRLIETRRLLGGRAGSYASDSSDRPIDNCQHVLLGCCTNLIDLYDRLGVSHHIHWQRRLHFADRQGHRDVLAASPLPAPLHLGPAMLRFRSLGWSDKLAIARAMNALIRIGRAGRIQWAEQSFLDWLNTQRQPASAIERFWSVIVISACNQTPDRCSAAYAMQVFQEGLIGHRGAYAMGLATVPLAELYVPVAQFIERTGGMLELGTSAHELQYDPSSRRITGVIVDRRRSAEAADQTARRELLTADAYISALPADRLSRIAPVELIEADRRLAHLDRFQISPIIGIHLWFDRPVMQGGHLIFVDSPLQWIFDKGSDGPGGWQHLHGVISAADQWADASAERIAAMAVEELRAYLPAVAEANLVHHRVIKEKRATFSPAPGVDRWRPTATGPTDNLLLAGDWCDTGWPATMEGAVRSGYSAAGHLAGRSLVVPDLPVSRLCRLLGL